MNTSPELKSGIRGIGLSLREAWSALPIEKARGIVRRAAGAFESELKSRFLELVSSPA